MKVDPRNLMPICSEQPFLVFPIGHYQSRGRYEDAPSQDSGWRSTEKGAGGRRANEEGTEDCNVKEGPLN